MTAVIGCVERISRDTITGWACNQQLASRPVEVQLRQGGKILARARASQPRDDLASLGLSTINFGYTLDLPSDVTVDLAQMEVAVFGSRVPLPVLPDACVLEGMIETIERGLISGWAWRPGFPAERPIIAIRNQDGIEVAKVRADIPREDLAAAGIGDGAYGFVFDAFAVLDAAGVSVRGLDASFLSTGAALQHLSAIAPPVTPSPPPTPPAPSPVPQTGSQPALSSPILLDDAPERMTLSKEALDAIRNALGGAIGAARTDPS